MKLVDVNDGALDLPPMPPLTEEKPEEKPPIAHDFTDNPFSEVDPVHIPSEDEKNAVWEATKKRFKILHEEVKKGGQLSGDKEQFASDGSEMAANVTSALLGLLFSLMGEEYTVLAPSKEQAYAMILPASRIWVRHSKIAGEISPDYIDASACLKAVADYARTVTTGIRQIHWMKANGYVYVGQGPTEGTNGSRETVGRQEESVPPGYQYQPGTTGPAPASQNGASSAFVGRDDPRGYPPAPRDHGYRSSLGTVNTVPNDGLTEEQRAAHEKLLELARRDESVRRRRRG